MLNLHLLRIFLYVAEQKSFSRAAELMYISQPAISRGVQELERQLHTTLIDRSGPCIRLTEAGTVLFRHAQQLFAIERSAERALSELNDLSQGHLAIGASTTIGIYLLPRLLGEFQRRYRGLKLFLDIGNTLQILERLHTTPLDIAFVEGPVHAEQVICSMWRSDLLVPICAPDHHLLQEQDLTVQMALAEPFLIREAGSGTREVIESEFTQAGWEMNIAMELGSTEAIKQAVAAGLGISILSRATLDQELALGRLSLLNLPELCFTRSLIQVEVRDRPRSRALSAFLDFMAQESSSFSADGAAYGYTSWGRTMTPKSCIK
jgi:DNA-binding transcriptional LysR family regulator